MRKLYCVLFAIILIIPVYSMNIRIRDMEREENFPFPVMEFEAPPLMINGYMGDPVINPPSKFFGVADTRFETNLYLVQFSDRVGPETTQSLKEMGLKVHGYFPMFTYLVEFSSLRDDPFRSVRANIPNVRWMEKYYPEFRYPRGLVTSTQQNMIERKPYYVLSTAPFTGNYEEVYTERLNIGLYTGKYNLYPHQLREVIQDSTVLYVNPSLTVRTFNNMGTQIIRVDDYWDFGFDFEDERRYMDGSTVTFCMTDTGLDSGDPEGLIEDFLDFVVDPDEEADFPFLEQVGTRVLTIFDMAGDGDPSDVDGHGTHCAGSIIGNGYWSGLWGNQEANTLQWGTYSGSAPRGNLIFLSASHNSHDDFPPGNLLGISRFPYSFNLTQYNADIYSQSWGTDDFGLYGQSSLSFDDVIWGDPMFGDVPRKLVFTAGGNAGQDRNLDGVINWGSIGSPATAKNVVSVGASENLRPGLMSYKNMNPYAFPAQPIYDDDIADSPGGLAAFSSRGPTQDFRVKPDIVAPGTAVVSVRSTASDLPDFPPGIENYALMSGTSMATPLAAGAAGAFKEYLAERLNMDLSDIPSHTLKALLLTGVSELYPGQYNRNEYPVDPDRPDSRRQEIPFHAPNPDEGWGRMNLSTFMRTSPEVIDVIYTPEEEGIQWKETLSYSINVDTAYDHANNRFSPIKVLLAWHDYPGMPGTGGLMNDIDLMMEGPDGTRYFPNQFLDDFSYYDQLSMHRVSFTNNDGSWEEILDEHQIDGYAFEVKFENYPVLLTDLYFGLKSKVPVHVKEQMEAEVSIYRGTNTSLLGEEIYSSRLLMPNAVQPKKFHFPLEDIVILTGDVLVKLEVDSNDFDGLMDTDTTSPQTYKIINNNYIPLEEGNFMGDAIGMTNIQSVSNNTGVHTQVEDNTFINGYYARLIIPDHKEPGDNYPAIVHGVSLGLKTSFPAGHRDRMRIRLYENTESPDDLGMVIMDFVQQIPPQTEPGMVDIMFPRSVRVHDDALLKVTFLDDYTQGLIDENVPVEERNTWRVLTTGDIVDVANGNFMVDFYVNYFVPRRDTAIYSQYDGANVAVSMGENHGFIQYFEPDYQGYVPPDFQVHGISFPVRFNPHYMFGAQINSDMELRVYENPEFDEGELISLGDLLYVNEFEIPYGSGSFNYTFPEYFEIETGGVLFQVVFRDKWDHYLDDSLIDIFRDNDPQGVCWIGTDINEEGELINLEDQGTVGMNLTFSFEIPRSPWGEFNTDKFNNVQGIHLPSPINSGKYTIYLHGYNIPFPKGQGQPFSLVVSYNAGDVPDFEEPIVEPPVGDDDDKTYINDWMMFE